MSSISITEVNESNMQSDGGEFGGSGVLESHLSFTIPYDPLLLSPSSLSEGDGNFFG